MTTRAVGRRSVLACAAALPLTAALPARAAATASSSRYTMTAFTAASEHDLYVYESADALTFELLRGPAYRPPSGVMRDPSIFRHADGAYYLAYTPSGSGHSIGFARSADRISWTHLYDYPVPVPRIEACWAPEWFVDGDVHVIVSLGDGRRFVPYVLTAADSALRSWNAPTPMAGIEPGPLDLTSIGYIDTTVVRLDDRYYAFANNETTKYIELAVAPTLLGPYTFLGTGDWAGWGTPREGQSLIRLPDGGQRIYFDAYTTGKYFYSDSYDQFRTWTPPRELPGLSGTIRHATVFSEGIDRR
ncbi:glycoside hydrolase family 43 protein [Nocardia sp. NPDC051832]|uniref:glycoside hydrolase family 43 protein n=1 Tax=Nocardia sp. NPDC051832 TaxID=3155673 RepID=UPI00342ED000